MRGARPAALALVAAAATAVRWHQLHEGLTYPDAYQYLLMAKGISAHLRPVLELGPGGDRFVPNGDAAAKPVFPALVALVHALGFSWLGAARAVTAVASGAAVALAGAAGAALARSTAAGAAAAACVLLSPTLAFWNGFVGPEALAQALALAAAWALLERRATSGGILAGLAAATRPELAAVGAAAALAACASPRVRSVALRALTSGTLTLALVLAVLRPPLGQPSPRTLAAAAAALALGALLFLLASRPRVFWPLVAAGLAVAVGAGGFPDGAARVLQADWPLAAVGVAGAVAVAAGGARLAAVGAILAGVYAAKNPNVDRYFAQLVPLAALGAGLLVARARVAAVAVAAAAATAVALGVPSLRPDRDAFPTIARGLASAPPGPLVTAAPEAYGFWLPRRPVRGLRVGRRGLVILDGAQRAYDPQLAVAGSLLARVGSGSGFLRPDGRIDRRPALLVRGVVVRRPAR